MNHRSLLIRLESRRTQSLRTVSYGINPTNLSRLWPIEGQFQRSDNLRRIAIEQIRLEAPGPHCLDGCRAQLGWTADSPRAHHIPLSGYSDLQNNGAIRAVGPVHRIDRLGSRDCILDHRGRGHIEGVRRISCARRTHFAVRNLRWGWPHTRRGLLTRRPDLLCGMFPLCLTAQCRSLLSRSEPRAGSGDIHLRMVVDGRRCLRCRRQGARQRDGRICSRCRRKGTCQRDGRHICRLARNGRPRIGVLDGVWRVEILVGNNPREQRRQTQESRGNGTHHPRSDAPGVGRGAWTEQD